MTLTPCAAQLDGWDRGLQYGLNIVNVAIGPNTNDMTDRVAAPEHEMRAVQGPIQQITAKLAVGTGIIPSSPKGPTPAIRRPVTMDMAPAISDENSSCSKTRCKRSAKCATGVTSAR